MENESNQQHCPKCGKENPDDSRLCNTCSNSLPLTGLNAKISVLATVSFICALFGVALLMPTFIGMSYPRSRLISSEWVDIAFLIGVLILGVTVILGISSFIRIEKSGGKITGRGFAIGAILVSIFGVLLLLVLPMIGPRKRGTAYRMVCGINLSDLGKAMLIYAGDNDEKWPIPGGTDNTWVARIPDWKAENPIDAFDLQGDKSVGRASISASLYLLVKYCDVKPKSFVCIEDFGTTEFKPAKYDVDNSKLIDLWDFGPNPPKHCSYSYHQLYGPYRLTMSSNPGLAVAADRNPWIDSPFQKARDFQTFDPNGDTPVIIAGNATTHKTDGQNVLFMDCHVGFERQSFCCVNEDNIYTYWNGSDIRRGTPPKLGSQPADRMDSLLVNDPSAPK